MKIISILAQKGGTGKTALTTHIAASLSQSKKRVLVIDFDPQMNLTQSYELKEKYNVKQFLDGNFEGLYLDEKEGVYFLHGAKEIWDEVYSLEILKKRLELLAGKEINGKKIDYVIIDCSPIRPMPRYLGKKAIHSLNGLALYASDYVFCPVNASKHSVNSMIQLWEDILLFKKEFNPNLNLLGFVLNRIQKNRIEGRYWRKEIEKIKEGLVFENHIHESVDIEKATRKGQSVFAYNPIGRAAKEFKKVAKELIKKIEK